MSFWKELTKPLHQIAYNLKDEYYNQLILSKKEKDRLKEVAQNQELRIIDLQFDIEQLQKKEPIESYCDTHFKQIPNRVYSDKFDFKGVLVYLTPNELITPNAYMVSKLLERVSRKSAYIGTNYYLALAKAVDSWLKWTDDKQFGDDDTFLYPALSLSYKKVDCVAEYENVWTKDGLKQAKDIKKGDMMLSYDFDKKEYVYKPIINLWDKGVQKVKRVHFRDGSHIDVTDEHHMLTRVSKDPKDGYKKTDLKDINIDSIGSNDYYKPKVPRSKKLRYTVKDIGWLDEELCFVLGHFFAEGYRKGSCTYTCGRQVPTHIIPILESHNIDYHLGANGNGIPTLHFKGEFQEFLKPMLRNSFDMALPDELLYLPEEKLQAILDGYFLGDGHIHKCGGFNPHTELCFSTSCFKWANQMQQISCQIGKTLKIYKQENHQGVGNQPIYRCTYYEKSEHHRDYGYDDLSETTIIKIEDIGEYQTYDWEVQDTHNFFFANGICTAQCEDHSFILASCDQNIYVAFGEVSGTPHAFAVTVVDNELYVIETNNVRDVNRNAKVVKYEGSNYVIDEIISATKTYKVSNRNVVFGRLVK